MKDSGKYLNTTLLLTAISGIFYLGFINGNLEKRMREANEESVRQKVLFEEEISDLRAKLDEAKIERDGWKERYEEEISKIALLSAQIDSIRGTVGILEKIKRTDPELLKKYSKIYFLNENYIPSSLEDIPAEYSYNPEKKLQIHSDIAVHLNELMERAHAEGTDLYVISAYRSFREQAGVKSAYSFTYGAGSANQFSADQGYSEHQLGTTVDFTSSQNGENFSGFDKTPAFAWLSENAYKYGFILSYPKGNSYYLYEPWHWRFVGRRLASDIHSQGKNFYDLDQREIDQYLQYFFDK